MADSDCSHTILRDEPPCPRATSFEIDTEAWDFDMNFENLAFDAGTDGRFDACPHQVRQSANQDIPYAIARQSAARYEQPSLPRRRSRYLLRQSSNQTRSAEQRSLDLRSLPILRWHNSPPQDEAASLSAIHVALQDQSHAVGQAGRSSHEAETFHNYQGPSSTASFDSGASGSSFPSSSSARSASSDITNQVLTMKRRRRVRVPRKEKNRSSHVQDRRFKCTFCCDTFRHKFDWARHEKSLHLSLEEWRCTPHGAVVVRSQTGRVHCAYCDMLDPKSDHLDLHNHHACHNDQNAQRFFRRKDHLVQHLHRFHKLKSMPLMDDWKIESAAVSSRCGFCDIRLDSWEERTDHLTFHFRSGKTMLDWKGDHDFDPAVAARVTNSLPPYLIGAESLALVPFSATNPASIDHFEQISLEISNNALEPLSRSGRSEEAGLDIDPVNHTTSGSYDQLLPLAQDPETVAFAEILTLHLSRFARLQIAAGVVPTDDMFQRESRRVLYGDGDDTWNTTVADNADWLRSFRENNAYNKGPQVQANDDSVLTQQTLRRE
ncbi:hypothetical protein AA0117_g13206 [Alternaria alternata]|uniref:C2H2-type domain-containing protein n=1 Tax=Alternaria alternata TaxID=5599 RepID=A0A4Q4MRJ8_ALTAL|nr:hypothetical protein AA0117_g13206 [Alternaria alternata]